MHARLAELPSHGWVNAPTAITPLPEVAARLGAAWIGIKRDDQLATMGGSSKIRKLNYLLAQAPYLQAAGWQSAGAIGSGHLLALAQAARACGKRLHVHMFDEPRSPGIVENLAATVSLADAATFYRSRATLALRAPHLLRAPFGADAAAVPVVALGASDAAGTLGCLLAGLELATQLAALAPGPLDAIYVPLGTGGTALGIAAGLFLAGVATPVHAVAVVEHALATRAALRHQYRGFFAALHRWGLVPTPWCPPLPTLRREFAGVAYGRPTPASLAACTTLAAHGIALDALYTGKAYACMAHDLQHGRVRRVLFWHTLRGAVPEPAQGWQARLPPWLRRKLA